MEEMFEFGDPMQILFHVQKYMQNPPKNASFF
jgi:hypothetical protein